MNTSPAPIRLEPLPTAFAPPEDPVCVATPTCCCCCCCLATLSTTTTYPAAEAYYSAVENEGSPWLALTLALLGGAATVFMLYGAVVAFERGDSWQLIIGGLGAMVLNFAALAVARYQRPEAWMGVFAPAAALPLALVEAFVGLMFGPAAFALGLLAAPFISGSIIGSARDRHRARRDTGPTAVGSDAASEGS